MKTMISTAAMAAMAMVVSVAAAGVSQEQIPQAQRPGAAAADTAAVTLTGCVARGTAADTYTLAETKKSAGSTPAADAAVKAEVVTLRGTEVDMSKHVGHSVTLTGSYAKPDAAVGTSGAVGASGTEKPAASAPSGGEKTTGKAFTVTSLKMVSPTC